MKDSLMTTISLLFLTLLTLLSVTTNADKSKAKEQCQVDQIRHQVLEQIDTLRAETSHPEWQYLAKKKKAGLDGTLVLEFAKICGQIEKAVVHEPPLVVLETLWSYILASEEENNIRALYSKFRNLQVRPDPLLFSDAWKSLADASIYDSPNRHSALTSLGVLQDMIFDDVEGHKSIFESIDQESKGFLCDVYQSPNQIIFNTYTMLQLTQLKAYTLLQFSYMLLRLYNMGNFTTESEILRNTYMERINQQEFEVKRVLDKSSRELWMCDPKKHVLGDTYTQLTNFIQGFLVNEVDLNSDNTCRENCGFYKYAKQHSCFKNQFCSKQPPCKGNVVGCQFVDSDMWVCQAPHFSGKRYEWIEYENGRTLGQRNACSRAVSKVDSWWRYLLWHCSYCFCFCDDPSDETSDRYFNLRPVLADVENNKVVTGLRFVKSNRVIHLQIQQGELIEHGEINASTVAWRPVDDYKITDPDVKVGIDYHMLTWEHRAIDLDDLKLPENHILTGVKLRRIGGHLNLEVQGSEFNFTGGKLLSNGKKSMWLSSDNTDGALEAPRAQIKLLKPDTPVKTSGLHYPDSRTDTFIEFTSSDVDLDVGQTPVPFIDTQPVAPRPPTPLTGAGLYHKGRQYSGGYVAPKVITLDYSQYIVTPENDEIDF